MKEDSNPIMQFIKRHLIIVNLIIIILLGFILSWAAFASLDIFTEHGESYLVPEVKHKMLNEAGELLDEAGLEYEVTDSVYDNTLKPGQVAEQSPAPGSYVKSNRSIYLTINAFSPSKIILPSVVDASLRQAKAMLEGVGIVNIKVKRVKSPYEDLVIGCKMNGLTIVGGTEISSDSYITLEVGDGSMLPPDEAKYLDETDADVDLGNFKEEEDQEQTEEQPLEQEQEQSPESIEDNNE